MPYSYMVAYDWRFRDEVTFRPQVFEMTQFVHPDCVNVSFSIIVANPDLMT